MPYATITSALNPGERPRTVYVPDPGFDAEAGLSELSNVYCRPCCVITGTGIAGITMFVLAIISTVTFFQSVALGTAVQSMKMDLSFSVFFGWCVFVAAPLPHVFLKQKQKNLTWCPWMKKSPKTKRQLRAQVY